MDLLPQPRLQQNKDTIVICVNNATLYIQLSIQINILRLSPTAILPAKTPK